MSLASSLLLKSSWLLRNGWSRRLIWRQCPSSCRVRSWSQWYHKIVDLHDRKLKMFQLQFLMAQMDSSYHMRQVSGKTPSKQLFYWQKRSLKQSKSLIMIRLSKMREMRLRPRVAMLTRWTCWLLPPRRSPSITTSTWWFALQSRDELLAISWDKSPNKSFSHAQSQVMSSVKSTALVESSAIKSQVSSVSTRSNVNAYLS